MKVELVKTHPDAIIPTLGSSGAAAYDLYACLPHGDVDVFYGQTVEIGTGISLHPASGDVAAIALPRSGLGSKGLILANTVGLIDSDYQGEIILMFYNRRYGCSPFTINHGDRVAQLLFTPVLRPDFKVVPQFSVDTSRGSKGFGSTG